MTSAIHPTVSAAPPPTPRDGLPHTADVLVAGAGPTGLALACVLAEAGVSCLLVDRQAEGANTSRAAVIHARTLEVLDTLRVTERLLAGGHVVPTFALRDRGRVLATIPFDRLPTPYPYTLMIPQCDTEAILLDRLRALGGAVHRPWTLQAAAADGDGVTATLSAPDGRTRTVRARYLVGADGMHSAVRELAGIGFTGAAYDESFVLADVRMAWPLSTREVNLFLSPDGLVVVAPLPHGRHRVVATMDDAPEHPDLADVQRLIDTRGPRGGAIVREVIWSSRFRVHHRLADRYRAGRFLLAGDAAHVHSPAGGQGMNTGIQDGVALGHALVDVLRHAAPDARLDAYEQSRRPVADGVVAFTHRMTRMATLRSRCARMLRNTLLTVVGRLPAFRRRMALRIAGLHVPPAVPLARHARPTTPSPAVAAAR